MNLFKSSLIVALLWGQIASANSIVFGHNLGITTDSAEGGTFTAGTYFLGYAPTDSCMFGTSPWMAAGYNSYSLLARCRTSGETEYFRSSALQAGYIKSDDSLGDFYQQDFAIVWWAFENKINDAYTLYTSINYMYFWDETVPMSLRREPYNDQPWQWTISTLHQLHWTETMGFQFELAILGLNYKVPRIHGGYSSYKKWSQFLLQLGLSMTGSDNNFDRLTSQDSVVYNADEHYDFSVHPEVQLQYFF
ncbi:hypothetical protein ACLVWU_01550 [Bdellovibrio sp. HCB290]|uniref:hypothetical protein n=1 Tax=Bdellovibrio sp. HCB290 TaxID=3394356 RepID=UPI0039B4467B